MKKIVVVSLFVALILDACTSSPKSYIIEGVVPDDSYNNQMVYMSDYETRENTDSALVVDGKFTFTGSVDTTVIRRLGLEQLYVNFILENGKISVDMADPKSAKGTPLNNELSKYYAEIAVYEKEELWEKIAEIAHLEDEIRRIRYNEIHEQYRQKVVPLCIKYFNANKNNALGIFILWNSPIVRMPELFDSLYAQAGDIVRNFKTFKNLVELNVQKKQTAEGRTFIDFTIENGNMDGSKVSLSDYVGKGKYVLVDFWASWCAPCIAEIPVLVEVYNKYKGDKFDMLGVAVMDKREETLKSIESHKTLWTQILDAGDIPLNLYGISGIPHIILFGPDGTIVARDLRGNGLKAKVEEVMCDCY